MGDPITPKGSEKEKNSEGNDKTQEKEEKKKKGRTHPRIGEIPR